MTVQSNVLEINSGEAVQFGSFAARETRGTRIKDSLVISQLVTIVFFVKKNALSLGYTEKKGVHAIVNTESGFEAFSSSPIISLII